MIRLRLQDNCRAQGLSLPELSWKSGVKLSLIQGFQAGVEEPTTKELCQLVLALGVPMEQLVEYV